MNKISKKAISFGISLILGLSSLSLGTFAVNNNSCNHGVSYSEIQTLIKYLKKYTKKNLHNKATHNKTHHNHHKRNVK